MTEAPIFEELADELARRYNVPVPQRPGPPLPRRAPDADMTTLLPRITPTPRPRPTQARPAQPSRDESYALLHHHIDQTAGSIHARFAALESRLAQMEYVIMGALENLTAQVDNVEQTFTGTVGPALTTLAGKAGTTVTGVPEELVQAQADRLSSLASQAAGATQKALADADAASNS